MIAFEQPFQYEILLNAQGASITLSLGLTVGGET